MKCRKVKIFYLIVSFFGLMTFFLSTSLHIKLDVWAESGPYDGLSNDDAITIVNNVKNPNYTFILDESITDRVAYKSTNTGVGNSYGGIKALVNGPGIFKFDYKIGSEASNDYLMITIDDDSANYNKAYNYAQRAQFSGSRDYWTTFEIVLSENKEYSIQLLYYKNSRTNSNPDMAWVSNLILETGNVKVTTLYDERFGSISPLSLGENMVQLAGSLTLTATPNSNGIFTGWRDSEGNTLSYERTYTFVPLEDRMVEASFYSNEDIYVAEVGTYLFDNFNDALSAAKSGDIIVMKKNITLQEDAVIPAGVMLLLPVDANDKAGYVSTGYNPNGTITGSVNLNNLLYRTLTIPEGITLTVYGKVVVNAVTGRPAAGHYDQDITGGYSKIILNGDIVVENGGLLDVFGIVEGTGLVTANSGGLVGDLYVVKAWRGGSQAYAARGKNVMPFNEYELQNIETTIVINYGAKYYGNVKMYASSSFNYTRFYQIDSSGIFKLTSPDSYYRREFDKATNTIKMIFHGNAEEVGGSINVGGLSISTTSFFFPFDYRKTMIVENGTFTFNNNVKFLTGSTLIVESNATLINKKSLIFYDEFLDPAKGPDGTLPSGTQYPVKEPAIFILRGTLNNNGSFGGDIIFEGGRMINATNANFSVTSPEVNGYCKGSSFLASVQKIDHIINAKLPELVEKVGFVDAWYYYPNANDPSTAIKWMGDLNLNTNVALARGKTFVPYWVAAPVVDSFIQGEGVTDYAINRFYHIDKDNILKVNVTKLDGLSYSYQWFKDGIIINGATTDSIIVKDATDNGTYYCLVTTTFDYMSESSESESFTVNILRNIGDGSSWSSDIGIDDIDTLTFNGAALTPNAFVYYRGVLLVEGEDYLLSYNDNINVGTAKALITGIGNYTGTIFTTFEITKKVLEVDMLKDLLISYPYFGSQITPDFSLSFTNDEGEVNLVLGTDFTVTFGENLDAGKDNGSITITGIANYQGVISKTFDITRKALEAEMIEITFINGATYTGNQIEFSVKVKYNGIELDEEEYSFFLTGPNGYVNEAVNAGTYSVLVVAMSSNFSGSAFTSFTISPKEVSVNWDLALPYTYDGTNQSHLVKGYYLDVYQNEVLINLSFSGQSIEFKGAGIYQVEASASDLNYILVNKTTQIEILKKTIDVVWNVENEYIYNGENQEALVIASYGLPNNDITVYPPINFVNEKQETMFKNAGVYTVTTSYSDPNYTLSNCEITLTILPKEVEVNWSVENNFVYNGLDQSGNVTAYIMGVNGPIDVALTVPEFTNALTYVFTASLNNDNYTLTNTSNSYTIVPLEVEVIWSVEDNFVYNGLDQSSKVTAYINGVGGQINVALTAPEFKNVGKFEFNASLDNVNYTLTNTSKSYTIVPLIVEVNWSVEDNFVYNGLDQKGKVTAYIEGVGSDDIIDVTLTAPEFKNVGTLAFVASLDNANYTLTNTSKSYTIVPLDVEVNWSVEDNFVYNGLDQRSKVSAYIEGVESDGTLDVTLTIDAFTNAGTFAFVASIDNVNYTLTNVSKSYTIIPLVVEVNWSAEDNFVYNGLDQKGKVSAYINGVGSDDDIIDVALAAPLFKNVGTYEIVASLDNANYTLTNTAKSYTIVPLVVNVNWSVEDEFVYNGLDQSSKVTAYIEGVGSDDIIDVTLTALEFKNVGTLAFVASLDNTNYTLTNTSESYTIVPLVVEVNWSIEDNFIYNGFNQSSKVTAYIEGVGNDGIIDIALTVDAFINVGEYEFVASLDNANYTLTNTSKSYTIVPLVLDVNWSEEDDFVYNGLDQKGNVSAYINGVGSDDDIIDVALTAPDFKNVGTFAFIASLDNANYTLSNTAKSYTIVPLVVNVNWSAEDDFVYNGLDQKSNVTANINGVGSDSIIDVTLTEPNFKNVGEYEFVASLDNANYTLTNTSKSYTIVPLIVEVNWSVEDNFEYSGFDQRDKVSAYINSVGNDGIIDVTITTPDFKNAGKFEFIANLDNTNYTLTNTSNSYTIVPLVVDVSWSVEDNFEYSGLDQSGKVTAYIEGVGNDGIIDVTLIAPEFKNAGKFEFIASLDNDNYTLTNTAKSYTIVPYVVEVSWSVEDNFIYNGLDQKGMVTANINGVGNDDIINVTLTAPEFKNVGTFGFIASLDNANYTLTNTGKSYTIVPLVVEVNWSVEDNFEYSGVDQRSNVTAYINGVGNDDIIDVTLTAPDFKNVGTFAFVASLDNANYTLTNTAKLYTIVPLVVNVNWSVEDNFTYNGLDQKDHVSAYINGAGSDDIIDVTLTAPEFKDVGKFEFIASLDNANYTLTNSSKSYTIVPFEVEVIWSAEDNFIYNGLDQSDKISAYINGVSGKIDVTLMFTEFKNVGEYEFVASLDNINYSLINNKKTYQIDAKTLVSEMIKGITSYSFTGIQITPEFTVSFINEKSDLITLSDRDYTITYGANVNAGVGTIAIYATEGSNYEGNATINFTIAKRQVNNSMLDVAFVNGNSFTGSTIAVNPTVKFNDIVLVNESDYTYFITDSNGLFVEDVVGVGTYTLVIVMTSNNFTGSAFKAFTINPKEVEVTWDLLETYLFDATNQEGNVKGYFVDVNGNEIEVNISFNELFINAGEYLAYASTLETNYVLTNITKEITIMPKTVDVDWTYNQTYMYEKINYYDTVQASYLSVSGEVIPVLVSFAGPNGTTEFMNAGEYTLMATGNDSNYVLTNQEIKQNILPKEINALWSEENNFVYNGFDQRDNVNVVAQNVIDGDLVDITLLVNNFTNVGKYEFNAIINNPNYQLINSTNDYQIIALNIEVNWSSDDNFVYNGLDQQTKVYANISGVGNDKNIDILVSIDEFKNVGTFEFIASLDNDNYALTNTSKSYTIVPLTVEVIWSLENNFIYNGEDQSGNVTAYLIGVGNDGEIEVVLTVSEFINVGTFDFIASLDNTNYTLTNESRAYTIIPLTVEVNWSEANDFTYNGNSQNEKVEAYLWGALGEKIDVVVTIDDFINVNSYLAFASLANQNYHLTNITNEYRIVKATISVLIDHKTGRYNEELLALTYQVVGEVYNDDDLKIKLSSTAFKGADVGTYEINGTFDNKNYEVEFINGVYEVIKAEQTLNPLTINDLTLTYESITVQLLTGVIYSIDGVEYTLNNVFTGLLPLTEYSIYAKLQATSNYNESLPVSIKVTTLANTRSFDDIVQSLASTKVASSFTLIKQAYAILNEIGAEHFDASLVEELNNYALAYNQYVEALNAELVSITAIGNQLTKPFDLTFVVIGLLNVLIGSLSIVVFKKWRKE